MKEKSRFHHLEEALNSLFSALDDTSSSEGVLRMHIQDAIEAAHKALKET